MILVDTHVLIWDLVDDPKIGAETRTILDQALTSGTLAISAFSFWEIAMLMGKGRLRLAATAAEMHSLALDQGVRELPVSGEIGIEAATLPGFHPDPADRIIVATALRHGATLVTVDEAILGWNGALERLDARL